MLALSKVCWLYRSTPGVVLLDLVRGCGPYQDEPEAPPGTSAGALLTASHLESVQRVLGGVPKGCGGGTSEGDDAAAPGGGAQRVAGLAPNSH